jgi:hypothetical protein
MPVIDAERERLCALLRDPPAVLRITPAIVDAARNERLHLVLAYRWADRVPELADDLRAAAAVEAAREAELRGVVDALADAGTRPVLIKGGVLAYTHYRRPELRPRDDTDLMVAPNHRHAVARVLIARGYQRPAEVDGELTTAQFHFDKRDRSGILHALDVHWRISNVRVFADVLSYDELARDAVPIPALGPRAKGAAPMHALLLACVHRVAHHADSDYLVWLYDIHLLARECNRAAFIELAAERRMRAVCARSLQLAAEAFGGIDPAWIAALLDSGQQAEPAAAFLGGKLRQIDILRADLAATRGWQRRVQLLQEHLFPKPAFMYERYATRRPLALPFLYLHRLFSGLPKWFRR